MLHLCYTFGMAARNPRIHTVLEAPLYKAVSRLAKAQGTSLSKEVRDLVRRAVDLPEDRPVEEILETRRTNWGECEPLTAKQLRARLRKR